MLTKFVLVFLFFTPDFSQYKDTVGVFATRAACEKAQADFLQQMKRELPKEFHYVAVCKRARGVGDQDA